MQKGPRARSRRGWPCGGTVSGSPGSGCHPSVGLLPAHGEDDGLRLGLQPPSPGSAWGTRRTWAGPRDSPAPGAAGLLVRGPVQEPVAGMNPGTGEGGQGAQGPGGSSLCHSGPVSSDQCCLSPEAESQCVHAGQERLRPTGHGMIRGGKHLPPGPPLVTSRARGACGGRGRVCER